MLALMVRLYQTRIGIYSHTFLVCCFYFSAFPKLSRTWSLMENGIVPQSFFAVLYFTFHEYNFWSAFNLRRLRKVCSGSCVLMSACFGSFSLEFYDRKNRSYNRRKPGLEVRGVLLVNRNMLSVCSFRLYAHKHEIDMGYQYKNCRVNINAGILLLRSRVKQRCILVHECCHIEHRID